MITIGYLLSGLIAVGIVFIGSRFLWDPAAASSANWQTYFCSYRLAPSESANGDLIRRLPRITPLILSTLQ